CFLQSGQFVTNVTSAAAIILSRTARSIARGRLLRRSCDTFASPRAMRPATRAGRTPAGESQMNNGRRAFSPPRLPADLMRALSPKRRELVRPILDRPRDYVLLSARKLAHAVGADAMGVLRAIRAMGFHGYDDFRRYLHELALVQATQLDTMQRGFAPDSKVSAQLQESLARDGGNLAALGRTL